MVFEHLVRVKGDAEEEQLIEPSSAKAYILSERFGFGREGELER